MKRIVAAGCVVALVVLLILRSTCGPSFSELKSQADSLGGVYTRDTARYAADTLATDSVLAADSAKPAVKAAVQRERNSCSQALSTCAKQKENYRKQIKALTPPTLRVFGELNYETPFDSVGTVSARVGAALRLNQDLDAQVYVDKPLFGRDAKPSLNIGIRKSWRLL